MEGLRKLFGALSKDAPKVEKRTIVLSQKQKAALRKVREKRK